MTVDELLDRLERVKRNGDGWLARCPAHEDRNPSLSIGEGDEGRLLIKCHAGCSATEIVSALGLELRDLYAVATNGRRVVATYDYVDEDGALLFQVVRFEPKAFVQRRPDGRGGWVWKVGKTRRVLYRLPLILQALKYGHPVWIAEGEKDVHALEDAGVIATCNAMGAGKWNATYTKALRGADVVIVRDHDPEGIAHAAKVAESLMEVANSIQIVEAADGKDAADHLAAGHTIDEFIPVPLPDDPDNRTYGREPASLSQKDVRAADLTSPGQTPSIALKPNILGAFVTDLHRAGVAGEEALAQLEYLCLTSRLLPWGKPTERPVSVISKGSTSTGKSHTTKTTLRFFPAGAYIHLGSMSRKYLFYTEEEFEHRFLYVPEWSSVKDDEELVSMLRILLSEGRISHGTVEGEGKRTPRRIEKSGPTGLLMTTTEAAVDAEMETRCLSIVTDDSTEQTRAIFGALAALEDELESPVDFAAWHGYQEWLAGHGETRVYIGFTGVLAELMPAGATRLRRDFVTLLCLIRAHTILYRAQRTQDAHGRIVATVEGDYAPVRALVAALLAEGADAGVSAAIRVTVDAVRELAGPLSEHVSPAALAKHLAIGKSATYDRIRRALAQGYIVNVAKKDERRMKLVVGTALPGDDEFLPSVDAVMSGCCPDEEAAQVSGSTMRPDEVSSGSPTCPADPMENTAAQGDLLEALRGEGRSTT